MTLILWMTMDFFLNTDDTDDTDDHGFYLNTDDTDFIRTRMTLMERICTDFFEH